MQVARELTKSLAHGRSNLAPRSTNLDARSTNLAARSTNLAARPTNLAARSTNLAARSTDLAPRSTNLVARSTNLAVRSTNLAARSTNLAVRSTNPVARSTRRAIGALCGCGTAQGVETHWLMRFCFTTTLSCMAALGLSLSTGWGNPIMAAADPHAIVIQNEVWMYPTRTKLGMNFFAYRSTNLKDWEEHGPLLDFKDVPWIREDGRRRHGPWVPCLAVRDGKYYFYYSVGPQSDRHPSRIGVAVGDSPHGPFTDSGKALLTGGNGFEAIDPMVFEDPASKIHYFYAGGSAGATMRVFEMNDDMIGFRREIEVANPPHFTEGPFIHFHAKKYHLTYSHGGFRDATYSVHYATSDTPVGPWDYRGPLLQSDKIHKGPGHHSIIQFPAGGDWFIIYHRWNKRAGAGPYSGYREIAIERIHHDEAGLLQPVKMTDDPIDLTAPAEKR